MAAIAGPKLQMPPALSKIATQDAQGMITGTAQDWSAFFSAVQQVVYNGSRSGPTASRPTDTLIGRYVGMPYYDTTLGKPIWLESTNPDVWVDATGAAV
jgi:hypothetical protein